MILLLAAACTQEPPPTEDEPAPAPIVVLWTLDTLGSTAARGTDWCGRIGELLAPYELSVACTDGISPSSWTGESHTRVMWPEHQVGDLLGYEAPDCGTDSVLGVLGRGLGARVSFAADNGLLRSPTVTCGGQPSWYQDADDVFLAADDQHTNFALVPEEERPVAHAIDAFVARVGDGEPEVVFLNSLEVGGHFPRCWFAPDTEACVGLWRVAREGHLVGSGSDPTRFWLSEGFKDALLGYIASERIDDRERIGQWMWDSMQESIEYQRGPRFEDRLVRVLDAAQAAGRLDDLVLVMWGDHGETPCEQRPVGDKHLLCVHGALPNEFTANVPLFVSPPEVLDAWEARGFTSRTRPFSMGNLSRALVDTFDLDAPRSWPAIEPVGAATSITCRRQSEDTWDGPAASVVRVIDDQALRCQGDDCVATTWQIPDGPAQVYTVLPDEPSAFASFDRGVALSECQ